MAELIPVRYGSLMYPLNVKPTVGEVSLRFNVDKSKIEKSIGDMKKNGVKYFSLHTQEPYTTDDDDLKNSIINNPASIVVKDNLINIKESPTNLWSSREWIDNFIIFLKRVSESFDDKNSVRVVELHTPRNKNYINSIDTFMDKVKSFYDVMSPVFPKAEFVVENSFKKPLLYGVEEINEFSDKIDELGKDNYKIGIALDIPQLLKAKELRNINAEGKKIENLFKSLERSRHNIRSIHLSGAKAVVPNGQSHHGDLNSLFHHGYPETNEEEEKAKSLKQSLLKGLYLMLSDENKRYLVPELNGNPDNALESIIRDLNATGVKFDYSPI